MKDLMKTEMTEEIAYRLGSLDFPNQHLDAVWHVNKESFDLAAFIKWRAPAFNLFSFIGGYPVDWEGIEIFGSVDFSKIKNIDHKISYIKGAVSKFGVINGEEITFSYPNSDRELDFLSIYIIEVLTSKFSDFKFEIEKGSGPIHTPLVHWLKIKTDPKILKIFI